MTIGSTYQSKRKKICIILFHSKIPHTIIKVNDKINMDSTITGSMNDKINMDSTIRGSMNTLNDKINMNSTITGSMNTCSYLTTS